MMEIAFLEELARDGVYEFAFFGAALRLRGATGSPMHPWAMPLRTVGRVHRCCGGRRAVPIGTIQWSGGW